MEQTKTNKTQNLSESNPLIEARNTVISIYSDTTFRIEWIKNYKGIDFVNDAKSSSVLMSLEAMEQCNCNLIWIASDENLMTDLNLIKDVLAEKVRAIIYVSSKSNPTLEQGCKDLVKNVLRLGTLEEAVQASLSFAQESDCVLFSPASPSYLKLETIAKRGELFNSIMNKL